MTLSRVPAVLVAASLVSLLLIAWASPEPNRVTDREIYERTAAQVIVPDCSDLQCFRVLVPWVLGRLPSDEEAVARAEQTLVEVILLGLKDS